MKIKKLEIENFKLFESNFDQINEVGDTDLILLNGPNGYGKTTVFDALELALTGEIKRILDYNKDLGVRKNEKSDRAILVADPSKEAKVLLTLVEDDMEFQLGRFYEGSLGAVALASSVENNPHLIFDKFKRKIFVGGIEIDGEENQNAFLREHHLDHVAEFFNKCCFLSQDEHLQFLKESRIDKSNALKFLFQLPQNRQEELDRIDRIISSLKNSNRTNNLGYLTKIERSREQLQEKVQDLEKISQNHRAKENADKEVKYQCLFPEKDIKWDQEVLELTDEEFAGAFDEIENLTYYARHQDDCLRFIWNKPFRDLMVPFYGGEDIRFEDRPLEYACRFFALVQKGEGLEERYHRERLLGQLGKNLEKRELHKIDWKVVSEEHLMEEDAIDYIKEEIAQVQKLQQIQGTAERVLTDIIEARNVLFGKAKQARAQKQKVIDEGECPFCGKLYGKEETLEEKFAEEEKRLLEQSQGIASNIQNRMDEMYEKHLSGLLDKLNDKLQNRVSESIYQRYQEVKKYRERLNEISDVLQKMNIGLPMEYQEDIAEVHRNYDDLLAAMEEKIKKIPKDVVMHLEEKDFWKDYDKYYDRAEEKFLQNTDVMLQSKHAYIEKLFYDSNRKEILRLKGELNKIQGRHHRLTEYYNDLCEYRDAIKRGIEEYKREVIHDIEPLLHVYTAKILQQKFFGKSIFVLTDENMNKFQLIHSAEDNQDILYNMSSGQLAAVSLSFLLCMHQVYARKQSLPILLIDDPIQTIDDVNMVGLVDILRFEFGDAQIFISTHEQKFEWYLKYKYAKAEKKMASYNMKDMILQMS